MKIENSQFSLYDYEHKHILLLFLAYFYMCMHIYVKELICTWIHVFTYMEARRQPNSHSSGSILVLSEWVLLLARK